MDANKKAMPTMENLIFLFFFLKKFFISSKFIHICFGISRFHWFFWDTFFGVENMLARFVRFIFIYLQTLNVMNGKHVNC